ncbi:MAG: hypothetical protein ACI8XM_001367, partial [Haloarculaceae archaeon]
MSQDTTLIVRLGDGAETRTEARERIRAMEQGAEL